MSNNNIDRCAVDSHSLNVFGDEGDLPVTAAEVEHFLELQQALIKDKLRGNENNLNDFHGPLAHVPDIGLLMRRAEVSENDFTLQNPQVNPKIIPYDRQKMLDARDMLHGASRWEKPIGTCFMTGSATILAARHSFVPPECTNLFNGHIYVVFGHSVLPDGGPRRSFTVNKHVFRVKPPPCIDFNLTAENDWIKLELDDPDGALSNRPRTETIRLADSGGDVYTLGHPNGLTLQYSRSKRIDNGPSGKTFRAFIDGCPCSSGSPVFDFATDKLVGMQIRSRMGSGQGRINAENRAVSLVCVDGGGIEAPLCVASDAFT